MNRPKDIRRIFAADTKQATILSIIMIIAVSYGLFYYLQNNTEKDIRNSLYQQQEQRQIESKLFRVILAQI
jgi:flagellar biosynthesis protein FlhB